MENLNKINMKINSIKVKLSKPFLILMFYLVCLFGHSDGQSNNSNHKFQSHDEVLQVFKDIMIDKYAVSKSNTGSRYEFTFGAERTEGFKEIKITTENDISHSFAVEEPHECVFYQGWFSIGYTPEYSGSINFHLPKGDLVTVSNILKHNELEFPTSSFINLKYRKPGNYNNNLIISELDNGINIINGNGIIFRDNRYVFENLYLKNYIRDTLEYSKIANGEFQGRSFKANIVYLTDILPMEFTDSDIEYEIKTLFSGETVKYFESFENYSNGIKSGEQIYRKQGIVTKMEIYENGNLIKNIEYSDKVFPLLSDSLFGRRTDVTLDSFVNFLWSNQEKFKIDVDIKGYKSYSPAFMKMENYKGFTEEGASKLVYKRHGSFETNQLNFIGEDLIPKARANYSQGKLEGNVLIYDEYGNVRINAICKNGILSKATENIYSRVDEETYLSKTSIIIGSDIINWKTFDSKGNVLDEGFEKSVIDRNFIGKWIQ